MDELVIGDPAWLSTDVGPVIDKAAKKVLDDHKTWIKTQGKVIRELDVPDGIRQRHLRGAPGGGAPEPRYPQARSVRPGAARDPLQGQLNWMRPSIASTAPAIGLTLGVHTRIDSQAQYIQRRIRVGNVYINRNMIGAVVGVQPFGGQGLSGTGPKAGGPHYMHRFATERTVTINTAAVGGNASSRCR